MTNRPEWLLIDFAVTMLGATLVPISTWSRPRELEYVLAHCGVSTLITIPRLGAQRFLDAVAEMGGPGSARLPDLRRVVVASAERAAGRDSPLDDLDAMGRDVPDAEIDAAQRGVTPEDVACILYTSGTTSTPKGVQLCHGGLLENMWNIGERQHLTPADRMWMGISLFWSFGANALVAVMSHGGTLVLQEQLDAGEALALIERERCTVYYGTPNIALALTEHPDRARRDLSSLRTGAAIGPPAAMQMVMDLGAREICNVYGLTECYGNCSVTDAHDAPEVRLTTVGYPAARPWRSAWWTARAGSRCRPARSARSWCAGCSRRATTATRRRTRRPSTPTASCSPGTSGSSATTGGCASAGASRRWSRPAASTWPRSRSRRCCWATPPSSRPTWSGSPIRARRRSWSRWWWRSPGRDVDPAALRALCRDALAAYKVPQEIHVMAREALPVTSTGKVQKFKLAEQLAAQR